MKKSSLFIVFVLFCVSCTKQGTTPREGTTEGVSGKNAPVGKARFLNLKGKVFYAQFNQTTCSWVDAINEYEPGKFQRMGNLETTGPIYEITNVEVSSNGQILVDYQGRTYQYFDGLACLDPQAANVANNRFIDYWCGLSITQNGVTEKGDVYFYRFPQGQSHGDITVFSERGIESTIFSSPPVFNGIPLWNEVYWLYPDSTMEPAPAGNRRIVFKSDTFFDVKNMNLTDDVKKYFPPGRDSIIFNTIDIDIRNPKLAYESNAGRFPAYSTPYSGFPHDGSQPVQGWCRLSEFITY